MERTIALCAIPGQFPVEWKQDIDTGTHVVRYGAQEQYFAISEYAFKRYQSDCRHAVSCSGWILNVCAEDN